MTAYVASSLTYTNGVTTIQFDPTADTLLLEPGLRLPIRTYVFRRRPDGTSASSKFRDREGTLFLVNGQAHGFIDKTFFKRAKLRLSYVADDILILVYSLPTRATGRLGIVGRTAAASLRHCRAWHFG